MAVTVLDVSGMNAGSIATAVSEVESTATAKGMVISSVASAQSGQLLIVVTGAQSSVGGTSPADEIAKLKKLADQNAIGLIEYDNAKGRILGSL